VRDGEHERAAVASRLAPERRRGPAPHVDEHVGVRHRHAVGDPLDAAVGRELGEGCRTCHEVERPDAGAAEERRRRDRRVVVPGQQNSRPEEPLLTAAADLR